MLKLLIERYPIQICGALIILSVLFIIVGHRYHGTVQAAMKQPLVDLPKTNWDWWSLSHFALFLIMGYVMPGRAFQFFALGALFEVWEDYMAHDKHTQLATCGGGDVTQNTVVKKLWCGATNDPYYYAKWDDPFINLAGYVLGEYLRRRI